MNQKTDLAALLEMLVVLLLAVAALFSIPASIKILAKSDQPPTPMQPITVNKDTQCGFLSFGCGGNDTIDQDNNGAWR